VRDEIKARREGGEPVDPGEHASGVVHEPGYLRRAANGHLVRRAIRHSGCRAVDRGAGTAVDHVRRPCRAPSGLGPVMVPPGATPGPGRSSPPGQTIPPVQGPTTQGHGRRLGPAKAPRQTRLAGPRASPGVLQSAKGSALLAA
jgi:hypothetical protein